MTVNGQKLDPLLKTLLQVSYPLWVKSRFAEAEWNTKDRKEAVKGRFINYGR